MKKLVCIFMIIAMMISVFSLPVSANIYKDIPETEYIYYDKVKAYIGKYAPESPEGYRELCYYSDENQEEPDWVLIVCQVMPEPWEVKYGALVGDRVLWTIAGSGLNKFDTGFAVYIPKTDTFIELCNDNVERIIELCPNFVEIIEEKEIGQLMGDVNEDNKIDVFDSTCIQRVLAEYNDYYNVKVWTTGYYFSIADFDRDGETTIMDATAIQRHIAGLE